MTQQQMLGPVFEDIEDIAVERRTEEVVLRLTYDRYGGDDQLPADEWAWRFRLGGVAAQKVDILSPSQEVDLLPRSEPR